jgi:hypothetical protein
VLRLKIVHRFLILLLNYNTKVYICQKETESAIIYVIMDAIKRKPKRRLNLPYAT